MDENNFNDEIMDEEDELYYRARKIAKRSAIVGLVIMLILAYCVVWANLNNDSISGDIFADILGVIMAVTIYPALFYILGGGVVYAFEILDPFFDFLEIIFNLPVVGWIIKFIISLCIGWIPFAYNLIVYYIERRKDIKAGIIREEPKLTITDKKTRFTYTIAIVISAIALLLLVTGGAYTDIKGNVEIGGMCTLVSYILTIVVYIMCGIKKVFKYSRFTFMSFGADLDEDAKAKVVRDMMNKGYTLVRREVTATYMGPIVKLFLFGTWIACVISIPIVIVLTARSAVRYFES